MADPSPPQRPGRPSRIPERFSLPPPAPVPHPADSEPPSGTFDGEDFLFHLSRGSDLLTDNQVERAKEELELALRVQPKDPRGQNLLGVVYFRLGLYPRAIDIYKEITVSCPSESTPKVNLALCYLKTGQLRLAEELLDSVVTQQPEHRRAWSYLGLVHQFQQDFKSARHAFEQAEQPTMARRMAQLEEQRHRPIDEEPPQERWELRLAAEHAVQSFEHAPEPFTAAESSSDEEAPVSRSGRWHALEPGDAAIPTAASVARTSNYPRSSPPPAPQEVSLAEPLPAPSKVPSAPTLVVCANESEHGTGDDPQQHTTLSEFCATRRIDGPEGTVLVTPSTLRSNLREPYAVRASAIIALSPAGLAARELPLEAAGLAGSPTLPLGGARDPIVGFVGPGLLLAKASTGILSLLTLGSETLTLLEPHLFGAPLDAQCQPERLALMGNSPLHILQIACRGPVAIHTQVAPVSLLLQHQGLVVRATQVVGWVGRVTASPLDPAEAPCRVRGFLSFSGQGWVLLT